jgi:hypothetical protein
MELPMDAVPMDDASFGGEFIDRDWINELFIRWKLADEYVADLEMVSLPAEEALVRLMRHDIPALVRELTRLRPELAYPCSP